ncbi:MAG: glycosyltransferase [Bacteroidales bacterium]
MHKVAFIILHYETLDDTIECVESILSTNTYPVSEIVIVDNGSKNKSGKSLEKKYKENNQVHVLLNSKNLGFSKGNNIGYLYAKETLKSDFIIIINNDTLIRQHDFIPRIINRYNLRKYDVLGPDILSLKTGSHQNPRIEVLNTIEVIRQHMRYFRICLFLNYFFLDAPILRLKKAFLPKSRLPSANNEFINPDNIEMEQVKLHGSAIAFSPDYVKKYDSAFYPETFLYCEESILYHIVQKAGLISVYYPDAQIIHKEDVTSDYLNKKELMKRRFYLKHNLDSLKVLLKLKMHSK